MIEVGFESVKKNINFDLIEDAKTMSMKYGDYALYYCVFVYTKVTNGTYLYEDILSGEFSFKKSYIEFNETSTFSIEGPPKFKYLIGLKSQNTQVNDDEYLKDMTDFLIDISILYPNEDIDIC